MLSGPDQLESVSLKSQENYCRRGLHNRVAVASLKSGM